MSELAFAAIGGLCVGVVIAGTLISNEYIDRDKAELCIRSHAEQSVQIACIREEQGNE